MHADALIPVPIHKNRLRMRGFNQAFILAKYLGELFGIKVFNNILYRDKDTLAQKNLSAKDRLHNLSSAFKCKPLPRDIKNIILVDDIYTTGATIEASKRALQDVGARNIYYISVSIGKDLN